MLISTHKITKVNILFHHCKKTLKINTVNLEKPGKNLEIKILNFAGHLEFTTFL